MRTLQCRTMLLAVTLALAFLSISPDLRAAPARRGYCSCSCSLTPNCTTDADCGGGRCLRGVTCC